MLTHSLRSACQSFISLYLFDNSVISLLNFLNSFFAQVIWIRGCDFALGIILSCIVFIVAEPLPMCDRQTDLFFLIWKLPKSALELFRSWLLLLKLWSFVMIVHWLWLRGRKCIFLLMFELFKPLLKFSDVEALVGIKIADLEGFGNCLLLLKNFVSLPPILIWPHFFLFNHFKL